MVVVLKAAVAHGRNSRKCDNYYYYYDDDDEVMVVVTEVVVGHERNSCKCDNYYYYYYYCYDDDDDDDEVMVVVTEVVVAHERNSCKCDNYYYYYYDDDDVIVVVTEVVVGHERNSCKCDNNNNYYYYYNDDDDDYSDYSLTPAADCTPDLVRAAQLPDAPQQQRGAGHGVRGGPDVRGADPADLPDPSLHALGSVPAHRQRRPGRVAARRRPLLHAQRGQADHHVRADQLGVRPG